MTSKMLAKKLLAVLGIAMSIMFYVLLAGSPREP